MEWVKNIDACGNILQDLLHENRVVGSAYEILSKREFWWTIQPPIFNVLHKLYSGNEFIDVEILADYFTPKQTNSLEEAKYFCYKTAQEIITKYGK